MLTEYVFGIRGPPQHVYCVVLFAFSCSHPSRSCLHLQVEMTFEIIELWLFRRVAQLLHSCDGFSRAVEVAGVCASERVTIFDESFHERERRPVWQVRNGQVCRRRPIIPLKSITCWNCCQRVSSAEFQLRIRLLHFRGNVDNLFRLRVLSFLQI